MAESTLIFHIDTGSFEETLEHEHASLGTRRAGSDAFVEVVGSRASIRSSEDNARLALPGSRGPPSARVRASGEDPAGDRSRQRRPMTAVAAKRDSLAPPSARRPTTARPQHEGGVKEHYHGGQDAGTTRSLLPLHSATPLPLSIDNDLEVPPLRLLTPGEAPGRWGFPAGASASAPRGRPSPRGEWLRARARAPAGLGGGGAPSQSGHSGFEGRGDGVFFLDGPGPRADLAEEPGEGPHGASRALHPPAGRPPPEASRPGFGGARHTRINAAAETYGPPPRPPKPKPPRSSSARV